MGTKVSGSSGGDYTPAPAGLHRAICKYYVDIGTQRCEYQGEVKWLNQVIIAWELPDETIEHEGKQVPMLASAFYTKSLHKKANLRAMLSSWRSRDFTEDELDGFDLDNILGKPCMLNIIHKPKQTGGVRAVVAGVMPLGKGMVAPKLSEPSWRYDIGENGYEWPEQMTDGLKKLVQKSREMTAANTLPGSPYGGDLNAEVENNPNLNDDIPF